MNIMGLGAIGELVGGVAVIASLVYVGFQVKQYTNTVRASSFRRRSAFNSVRGTSRSFGSLSPPSISGNATQAPRVRLHP